MMIRFASVPVALAAAVLPWSAFAACQQQGDLVCGGGAPSLSSPATFQVSRGGDFRPLDAGRPLRGGDRLLSGAGQETLSLGPSCSTVVGPGSLVSLSRSGGRTCARVTSVEGTPLAPEPATGVAGLEGPGLLAAGAVGAVGIGTAVAATSGGRPRPPVSAQ